MLCGFIQFLTWVLFWFIVLEVRDTASLRVAPAVTLFGVERNVGTMRLAQFTQEEFREPYEAYRSLATRAIGDQLWVAYIPFEAGKGEGNQMPQPSLEAMDRERTRLRELADDATGSFEKMAENVLKLSFAGTIIGIGQSLFEARNLDTADPIEKILVKSEMFAGIGTAFGNTLVGIGLSMACLFYVEAVLARWLKSIESNAQLIRDFGTSGPPLKISPVEAPLPPINDEEEEVQRSALEKFGAISLLLLVLLLALRHATSLTEFLSQAWSYLSDVVARLTQTSTR